MKIGKRIRKNSQGENAEEALNSSLLALSRAIDFAWRNHEDAESV